MPAPSFRVCMCVHVRAQSAHVRVIFNACTHPLWTVLVFHLTALSASLFDVRDPGVRRMLFQRMKQSGSVLFKPKKRLALDLLRLFGLLHPLSTSFNRSLYLLPNLANLPDINYKPPSLFIANEAGHRCFGFFLSSL